ncbi:MAG TPA: lysophospholipid acyltransferase family protein [Acidimicrobiales bacterium]|nr:lysophospholipid acyltransferase family protein [Acidimicrobiales bacterium]
MAYWVVKAVLTPLLRLLYRVRVEGAERVPRAGAVIVAPNHRSFLDSIFIPLVIPRRVTFVAKADYFDSWKTKWFFNALGQIPIRREGGSASERALASAMDVLREGGVFGIYPEGTRTRDGRLHKGHTGVARLALRSGAPIIPVGLIGTDEIQPVDRKLPLFFKTVTIRFGQPIDPKRFAGGENDRMVLRQITDEVMFELRELTGYEYDDTYATKKAEDVPIEPARLAIAAS